ncbi:hypothetical protein AB0H97_21690 [Streptomyces sp. NPDC050788]|uniref:hypothetical protein n=1 Tax=Streptomyces sp. NPDC050788 TaxID=3155041 RepID=UPI00341ADDCB
MSTARALSRSRAWLRALVLLCALLVPGTHAPLPTAPAAALEIVEYDVMDAAVRPPAGAVRRTVAPLRRAPLAAPAPGVPAHRPAVAPPRPPYALPALRTVVLRC